MTSLLILILIIASLALFAIAALGWGADSRDGVGDDHQRRSIGGVR